MKKPTITVNPITQRRVLSFQNDDLDIKQHDLCGIAGEGGWFRFLYHDDRGWLTLYGPLSKDGMPKAQAPGFRSVKPERITKVAAPRKIPSPDTTRGHVPQEG